MKLATTVAVKRALPRARGVERWASRAMVSGARQRCMLAALWAAGKLNRRHLHDLTGIRPNTVGLDIAMLLDCGILRELAATTGHRGRPGVPLEIDGEKRNVVGLAIEPGKVSVARLNLRGHVIESRHAACDGEPKAILASARAMLQGYVGEPTLAVGVSVTGSVDPVSHSSLYGSAWPKAKVVDLQSLYDMTQNRPLLLENDMHALAARWMLTRKGVHGEDVLLVHFKDGQLGASLLIEGRPNRGCITGANELGHTRLPIETELCHCGQTGCLERICSTPFVNRLSRKAEDLVQRAADYGGDDRAISRMIDLLAMGIANAINLSRVHRLVLVSEMTRHPHFAQSLVGAIERQVLPDLAQRVQIELWQQGSSQAAEAAGWLGLANLFLDGWGPASDLSDLVRRAKD